MDFNLIYLFFRLDKKFTAIQTKRVQKRKKQAQNTTQFFFCSILFNWLPINNQNKNGKLKRTTVNKTQTNRKREKKKQQPQHTQYHQNQD